MATDIVGSLFGVTPELYQEQRDLMRQKQAMEFAQADPRAQATFGLYRAGQQVGQALGGLMGAEDPQMRLISQRNALARQFDINTPQGLMQYSNALQSAGDVQGAALAADRYRQLKESSASIGLKEAQAEKAANWQATTTASERNRSLISNLEVKLAEGGELTPPELAKARFQIAQELKPKVFRDATTNELITIEPLDLNLAAPNLAKALGLGRPEGAPAGTGAKVIETPASKEAAVSQAEALGEVTNKTKDVISLIGKTRDLINPYSTGYGSFLKILPNTDAKSLENNLNTIKSNLAFAQLTALKDATKTGASGLGAVTVKEFEALQNSIAALDPSSKTFTQDLDRVEATYIRLLNNLEKKTERAETKAGIRQPTTPAPTATPTPALTASVTPKTEIAPNKSSMSGTTPSLTYGLKDYTRDEMINHVMAQYPKLTRQQAIDALTKAKARGF
jgi:hypothetical protein